MEKRNELIILLWKLKETIIERWIEQIEMSYPGQYDLARLRQNGSVYFELAVETHIPVKEHPNFSIIPAVCQYHADLDTPLNHLLKGPHLWRKAILDCLGECMVKEQVDSMAVFQYFRQLASRIDEIQDFICEYYWEETKQKIKLQEETISQLHHDRLSLLGKMAASLAHEIRNPLFAIEGFLKLIQAQLGDTRTAKVGNYFNVIETELKGVYGLITGFLSFSKNNGVVESKQACYIVNLIESVLELASPRLVQENIVVNWQACDLPPIKAQKLAVQQVISNLINNSIDALIECNESHKKISISCETYKDKLAIHIQDNGAGIPERLKEQLFSPFVTGKEHGTGLGLPICKQIMEKNSGEITFKSVPGDTTFTLWFYDAYEEYEI
jgi:two-component system, sporulation sensor kinase D